MKVKNDESPVGWVNLAKPNVSSVEPRMKHMNGNHRHKAAAAIAPGAVVLGFAGSTQPTGLENFDVKQTGKDPKHHTVILPEPVTQGIVDKFNSVFKVPE